MGVVGKSASAIRMATFEVILLCLRKQFGPRLALPFVRGGLLVLYSEGNCLQQSICKLAVIPFQIYNSIVAEQIHSLPLCRSLSRFDHGVIQDFQSPI